MAALEGALALAEVDDIAVVVRQDLDLDVPGSPDEPLQEKGVVAKSGCCHAPAVTSVEAMSFGPLHHMHTFATTTCGGLDQQGEADTRRRLRSVPGR